MDASSMQKLKQRENAGNWKARINFRSRTKFRRIGRIVETVNALYIGAIISEINTVITNAATIAISTLGEVVNFKGEVEDEAIGILVGRWC
jgi:hypothetical protein